MRAALVAVLALAGCVGEPPLERRALVFDVENTGADWVVEYDLDRAGVFAGGGGLPASSGRTERTLDGNGRFDLTFRETRGGPALATVTWDTYRCPTQANIVVTVLLDGTGRRVMAADDDCSR